MPANRNLQTSAPAPFPLKEADRCVLCGLCLPHCPTYRLLQDENESPRGRVSLLRAVATGALPMSDSLAAHLSRCLDCRACERACPSGVRYGRLIEAGRVLTARHRPPGVLAKLGLGLVTRPRLLRFIGKLLRLYQRSGMQRLTRTSGILRVLGLARAEALLPAITNAPRWQTQYPEEGARRGRVALFLGCLAPELDATTLNAAIRVMTRLGYDVVVPDEQTCCGALHRDAGDPEAVMALRERNRAAFAGKNIDAIITIASGCGTTLAEGTVTGLPPVRDINALLAEAPLSATLELAPLRQRVAVQDPCSLRNTLRAESAVYALLRRIPELEVIPLPENHLCCGGAGAYTLREPVLASRLRTPKIDAAMEIKPDVLVSANIGCALHIAAGASERGLDIQVVHPLVLFERQLRPKPVTEKNSK